MFQEHTLRVMTDLAQSLLPFSLDYTPELLDAYMGLFTAACRVHIIAANMPRPLILQASPSPPFTCVCLCTFSNRSF